MPIQDNVHNYYMPPRSIYGIGAVHKLPEAIESIGAKKPLIVTDQGIVKVGIVKRVTDRLDQAHISYSIFDGTVPNPRDENVVDGVKVFTENGCDSIITLGGGSSHDCGKAIALIALNGGQIQDYEGIDRSNGGSMPFIAINTTAGTAAEMTSFSIIKDTTRQIKMVIVDRHLIPNISINDPTLMASMPASLTAATGMDALTHAIEAYVSTAATPITDACAIEAFKLVFKYLRRAVANGQDLEAREGMCHAEYLAGMAFNNASLGYVHAMAHQVGGFYDLPHGECNAILLPHIARFNIISSIDKFVKMAEHFGENIYGLSDRDAADAALKAIIQLYTDIGIPSNLVELGKRYGKEVKEEDIPAMTRHAQKDICGLTNPRRATDEDIAGLFEAAYKD